MPAALKYFQRIFMVGHAQRLGPFQAAQGDFSRGGFPGGAVRLTPAEQTPTGIGIGRDLGFGWWVERRPAIMADLRLGHPRLHDCLSEGFHYNVTMSTMMSQRDIEANLANRLRSEREARGWTLADLAAQSGVSRAMVSKIERCEASPTAALLGRLSAALGLTLSQLFARVEDAGQMSRAAEQPVWRDPETGFLRRTLSPPGVTPLEMVWGELPPGATIPYPIAFSFIADQQLVVIDGVLTIRLGGTAYELGAGDCLRFGPPRELTFANAGTITCRYVIAIVRASASGAGETG